MSDALWRSWPARTAATSPARPSMSMAASGSRPEFRRYSLPPLDLIRHPSWDCQGLEFPGPLTLSRKMPRPEREIRHFIGRGEPQGCVRSALVEVRPPRLD